MKKYFLCIILILVALLLWSFTLAGLFSYLLSGRKFNRWISSGTALLLACASRLFSGEWLFHIGEYNSYAWCIEILFGLSSWCISAIIVASVTQYIVTKENECKKISS